MSYDTLQELDRVGDPDFDYAAVFMEAAGATHGAELEVDYDHEEWHMVELEDEPLDEIGVDPYWHVIYTPIVNGLYTETLSVYGIRAAAALSAELTGAGFSVWWCSDDGFGSRNFLSDLEQEMFDEELCFLTR